MKNITILLTISVFFVFGIYSCKKDKCPPSPKLCETGHYGTIVFKSGYEGTFFVYVLDSTLPLAAIKSYYLILKPPTYIDSIVVDTFLTKCYHFGVIHWHLDNSQPADSMFEVTTCVTDCDTTEIVFRR